MLPCDIPGPSDGAIRQPHVLAAAATGAYRFIREQGCDPDRVARSAGLRLDPGLSHAASLDLAGYCLLFEGTTRQGIPQMDRGIATPVPHNPAVRW